MRPANRSTTFAVAITAAIAVLAMIAWRNARLVRDVELARATLAQKSALLETETRRVAAEVVAANDEQKALQVAFDQLKKASAGAPATPPAPAPKRPWIPERLQKEPEFQVLWLAYQRATLGTRYGPFFQARGLLPAQVARFQKNAIKRAEQEMDLQGAARTEGMADTDATVTQLGKQVTAEYEAAQRELLGEDAFRKLQEYERGVPLRDVVSGLAGGAAVAAHEPLTAQQAEQLFQAIANASAIYRGGGRPEQDDVDWTAVDAEMEKFLSPTQIAFFKTHEPPLPTGGRLQSELYRLVERAKKTEAGR